jgi:hypothetical protein
VDTLLMELDARFLRVEEDAAVTEESLKEEI